MATLYFKISSDWEQVVKLRNEITKLENQLKSFGKSTPEQEIRKTEERLATTRQEFVRLTTEAAKAGAIMENDFKKKIYDASQSVNGFTEKIIAQKNVVKNVEADVKRLGEAYRVALKNNPLGAQAKLSEYNSARKVLDEERAALFGLTQQQAEARLSVKRLKDEYALYKKEAVETVDATDKMSISLGKVLGIVGGVSALKQLGSEIIRVRGEIESMETSIRVLLGDESDKLGDIMSQLKEYALISPLKTKDMAEALQMMMGFGMEAEESIRYLKAMGDISMGNTGHFKSLALAFSQMSAAGKLMGQDLNQMINAGFNPLMQISEQTGKSMSKLKDEMSKGAISAEMIQQAFIDATSEGGKFYGMAEEGAKTLNGQISMLEESIENAFNEMGQASEGVIMSAIQGATSLIENYETVGKVLVGLVATYGVYRTALMLATAATSKHTISEIALTNARVLARKAQLLLNAAMLTNPYVAIATVITGLVATMWALSDSTSAAENAQKRFNEEQDKMVQQEKERKSQVESLIRVIQDETETELAKISAYEQLQKLSPAITSAYKQEELAILNLTEANKLLNKERDTNTYDTYVRNIEESTQRLKKLRDENGKMIGISPSTGIPLTVNNDKAIAEEEAYLKQQQKALEDFSKKLMKVETETVKTTYKEDYENARKEWESAKKELLTIEADKDKFTTDQYEKAKKRAETAEKAYQNLGGTTKTPKSKTKKQVIAPSITVPDEDVTLITPEEIQESINLHREAMNQYLKDYGTYQEKRKAIADSYSMRIDEAKTEGERLYLQKKMEEELAGIDLERLKKGINWELIFGDLSHVTREELDKVRAQLEEFRLSKEYKNLSIDQKETVEKALNDIKSTMIDNGGLLGDLPARLDELREAQEELTAAQEAYNEALRDGTEWEQEAAMENLIAARNREANAQRGVSDATKKTIQNITTLTNVIAKLGSSSEMSMTDMGNMVEQVASLFGEMGSKVGGLIGAALSLIDVIQKQGMENFVMNISKMGNDLARETMEFFTFGLLDLGGLSNRNVDSDVERLTTSNNELVAALDRLRERMDDASVADSTGIYNLQTENLRQQERNYRQMMQEYGSVHDDGFLGMFGSHSSFYKVDEEMSANEWRRISGIVGKTIDSAGDFFNLTSEQMALVADNATDLYAKIKQYADDGVRDAAQYMDDYIQIYKELEELQDAYNEKLTSVSFDTVRDDFRNALLDMEDDTEAFADNFESMMQNAILESMMTSTYDKKLRDWYKSFSSAMEGGELTASEQKELKQEWDNIVNQASEEWNAWKDTMGWDSGDNSSSSPQQASRGYSITASQESIDETNGRLTGIQMAQEEIKNQSKAQTVAITELKGSISSLVASSQKCYDVADETRNILAQSYLELQEIRENTGAIVQPIKQIQKDIAEVKQNTARI